MWLQKLVACFDAAGLRGIQAEWGLGTLSHRELMKIRVMIRKKLSLISVVLLIEYDVLVILYYEINT